MIRWLFLSVRNLQITKREYLNVFDQIMSDVQLTEFLTSYDTNIPLLVAEAAEDKTYKVTDYVHSILELLVSKTNSELYREILKHQNVNRTGRRDLNSSRLLSFLFKDANRARRWSIWKPVGEYVLRYLHDRPGGIEDDHNREANYYTDLREIERYSDPVFIGLEYFDFMVKEALIQGVEWHM